MSIDILTFGGWEMALVSGGISMSVTLIDTGGNTAVKNYALTSADMTEALTDAAVVLNRLAGVSDAVVKGYRLCLEYYEDALVFPAAAQIENRASIVAAIADNPMKSATLEIPAPKAAIFVAATGPQSNVVNTAHADVAAYVGMFATGMQATVSDGEVIDTPALSGKRIHIGSRKG
jgi:hypothetical protein